MTGLAILLMALAVGDLVACGLSGEPESGRRTRIGILTSTVVALLGTWWISLAAVPGLLLVTLASAGTAGWLWAKSVAVQSEEGRVYWLVGLLMISSTVGSAVALSGFWVDGRAYGLERWLSGLPFSALQSLAEERFLLAIAVMLVLSGPANGVVRAVLTVAGTPWETSGETLRGGRYIGVLERWMIFALAVAGEPTAAALVVSAKSLLRFPELTSAAREPAEEGVPRIDLVTEYFLLGSLTSWFVALAPVVLFL